jgi:sulfur-carrier protein adenylyltransferase/sulfurtransferase
VFTNALCPEEKSRYRRHVTLREVGLAGQHRLRNARVLLVGTGGLGSPISLYLAAAGVGTLGLVDFDSVDESNLQRQVLFGESSVGKSKVAEARVRLADLNPHIRIEPHDEKLSSGNALERFKSYDIIVDATDNFTTRFIINDACVFLRKPLIYGSIFKFEGQVSVFCLDDGPCYRCLYPTRPPDGLAPNCAEAGVLGVLPGIIGTLQANEALKLILGTGRSLKGRLLVLDAMTTEFREFSILRNPDCPICSANPTIRELREEPDTCALQSGRIPEVSYGDFQRMTESCVKPILIDVRGPAEYEFQNLGGMPIPLSTLPERLTELDSTAQIVVHCESGKRSAEAVRILMRAGFSQVWNLKGGIQAALLKQ